MKKRKICLAAICAALLIAMSACCPCRRMSNTSTTVTKDSTNIEVRWRNVPIHDTAYYYIQAESHSSVGGDRSHLETSYAISDAYFDSSGSLHHTIENIPQKLQVPFDASVLVSDTSRYVGHRSTTEVTKVEYKEKELTKWQKLQMRGFWTLIAVVVAYIVWRTRKLWSKLL